MLQQRQRDRDGLGLAQELKLHSAVDGDSIQVNRLGDDQGGNRQRSGADRNASGAEEVKIHSRSAYTNAARALENLRRKCVELSGRRSSSEIPGIGKNIALKAKELAETGSPCSTDAR